MRRLIITFAVMALSVAAFAQELTILHLNDTHSHIDPERSGKHAGKGGVIEQALYIDEVRAEEGKKNVLLLHAGDDRISVRHAGGGAVEVTISGKKEVIKVKLDQEVVDPDDIEMLEDLIVAAVNDAASKADELEKSLKGDMPTGLGF